MLYQLVAGGIERSVALVQRHCDVAFENTPEVSYLNRNDEVSISLERSTVVLELEFTRYVVNVSGHVERSKSANVYFAFCVVSNLDVATECCSLYAIVFVVVSSIGFFSGGLSSYEVTKCIGERVSLSDVDSLRVRVVGDRLRGYSVESEDANDLEVDGTEDVAVIRETVDVVRPVYLNNTAGRNELLAIFVSVGDSVVYSVEVLLVSGSEAPVAVARGKESLPGYTGLPAAAKSIS